MKYFLVLIILFVLIIIPFYEHDNSYSCRHDPSELSALITQGKAYYFRVFVECRANFNDDALDELYRASGLFLKKQPEEFIQVISEFNIEGRELKNLLTMLPLNISGSSEQKRGEIMERTRLIRELPDSKVKSRVLEILAGPLAK